MASTFNKNSGGIVEKGIDAFNPDFNSNVVLSPNSYNLMTGINRGTGPRYGISPIPGHSNKDIVTVANSRGLRASEPATGATIDNFKDRRKFLGVLPISIGSYADLTIPGRMFLWLITDYVSSKNVLTATPNVEYIDGGAGANTYKYQFDLSYGFNNPLWDQPKGNGAVFTDQATGYISPVMRRIAGSNPADQTAADFMKQSLQIEDGIYFISSAIISVSGKQWPQPWLIGSKVANGDATHTATANFIYLTSSPGFLTGINPAWNTGKYKKSSRTLKFYNLEATQLISLYTYNGYAVSDSTYLPALNQIYTTPNFALTGVGISTTNLAGRVFVAANINQVLLNDPELYCDSSYTIALVAAKKPLAYVVQSWERDFSGRNVQVVSLTDRQHAPDVRGTLDDTGVGYYTEELVAKQTCWDAWPVFYEGTPTINDTVPCTGSEHISLGIAGSGVLRANTTYEFAFSIFDKQLGIESNVGVPAKIRTNAADRVRVTMLRDTLTAGVYQQQCSAGTRSPFSYTHWFKYDGANYYFNTMINFLEIRIYYRAFGSFEWLPAVFVDLAAYLYNPDYRRIWACQGDIAALPGGQPGGFVDYSYLPKDEYDCVVNFKNRAFWFSPSNAIFSLKNNPFSYPNRNAFPAPIGGYRGAILHTYRGESDQQSRLVIFGQKETYIGRFTGVFTQMPVVVSPDVTADYDVDGSDFNVEPWTSVTAFSYRSAVVADGDLYFWGPQGVYKDDGVGNPKKVSKHVEPDIFNLYDQEKTAEIHCHYDEKTKDIVWFYPPESDNTISYALTFDIENEEFFIDRFKCKIDWTSRVDTSNPTVTQKTNGLRTIIGSRKSSSETIQRGFFFDQFNRSGDMSTERELICKSVTDGSASNLKVLAFDSGLDATNFATIAVGDYIAISLFKKYTSLATGSDMIAKVSAIDLVTPTLTIKIPDGAVLPVGAVTERFYFPIYHASATGDGLNGFTFSWEMKYWMPKGVNYSAIWRYIYMFFKYTPWLKLGNRSLNLSYRTPSGGPFITDVINMNDNSDGNYQLYHPMRVGHENNQGQAIKLKLSGTHIGEEWMLQYFEVHENEETGGILQRFEG